MATKSKYAQKKIQDTEGGGFGNYAEDTGGGHPFQAGDSNTRTTKKNGQYRKENNDTLQPRTDDGKFTYKSVNGKSIDPKYGPSRGETVNPLLTGGKNGVKIEDVEKQFAEEKGDIWEKKKGEWHLTGSEAVVNGLKVKVAGQAIWDTAKEYDMVKGEFKGFDEKTKKYISESDVWNETKKGRRSMAMKAALQKAKKMKESQYVINEKTGGIQTKKEELQKLLDSMPAPKKGYKKQQAPASVGTAPTSTPAQPTQQAPVAPQTAPASQKQTGIKYNADQIETIKTNIKNKFAESQPEMYQKLIGALEAMGPQELDDQIDFWASKGANFLN